MIREKLRKTKYRLRKKYNEQQHRKQYPKNYQRMRDALYQYYRCNDKKSEKRIKEEIGLCKDYWGCYPLHYFRYQLYKKSKDLSEKELIDYVPEFFFYSLFLPYYDSRKYSILLEDKIITEQLFRCVGINQPETIGKIINGQLFTKALDTMSYDELFDTIQKKRKIFIKPADGKGGYGILIFNNRGNEKYINSRGQQFGMNLLNEIASKRNWIIQNGIEQDSQIASIYPDSVNTFRVATENKDGLFRVLVSTLRMGRYGSELDNGTQGGILVSIDLDTGEISDHAFSETCEYFEIHPDTQFSFSNFRINRWREVYNFVMDSVKRLPQFTYLGWDIALGINHPIAIEANLNFGLDHYQVILGGLRDIFGIENPDYYWENRGATL
jgi:hypothetical protein